MLRLVWENQRLSSEGSTRSVHVHVLAAILPEPRLDWAAVFSHCLDLQAEATRKEALYWNGQVQSNPHPDFVTVLFMQALSAQWRAGAAVLGPCERAVGQMDPWRFVKVISVDCDIKPCSVPHAMPSKKKHGQLLHRGDRPQLKQLEIPTACRFP
jgi:hypothetical protein